MIRIDVAPSGRLIATLAAAWVSANPAWGQNVLTPEIAVGLTRVVEMSLEPGDTLIAYVLSCPRGVEDEPGGPYTQLWVVPTDGGESRRLTKPDGDISNPRFSPVGGTIAFLASQDDEKTQIYLIPAVGGDPQRLTDHPTSIASFEWSPDGSSIAFLAPDEKTPEQEADTERGRDWDVVDEHSSFTRPWLLEIETNQAQLLIEERLDVSTLIWMRGSHALLMQAADTPAVDDHYMYSRIYRLDLDHGSPAVLCPTEGKLGPMAVSPDGARVAYLGAGQLNDPLAQQIYLFPLSGDAPMVITDGMQASVEGIGWLSKTLLVALTTRSTRSVFTEFNNHNGKQRNYDTPDAIIGHFELFSNSPGRYAAIGTGADHPAEVFVGDFEGEIQRLTNHNPALEGLTLARPETFTWHAKDKMLLQGVVTYPVGYDEDIVYPLVVNPHGGPESVSHEAFGILPQLLAARGFVVFQPNYRGSGGRGIAFAQSNHNDLGGREFQDILYGIVDLENRGIIDRDRVGIGGWSYGGYLSALAATHHTHYFKAAVMGAGISNWISFAGTTDITHEMQIVHWNQWWTDDVEIQWGRSPLSAIDRARTPMLILHGKDDKRVPPGQALEMYQALKSKGVATELVLYPRAKHGVEERAHRQDLYERQLAWFEKYLKEDGSNP